MWSPDGARIAYVSTTRDGRRGVYERATTGPTGSERRLCCADFSAYPTDWSPDGRHLLVAHSDAQGSDQRALDVWALPLAGDRKPFPLVQTPFTDGHAQFSLDGHWIAYDSNRTGQSEVYLQPFPGTGGELRVSTNGGAQVRWNPSGKEIFYIALDGMLMAVPVELSRGTGAPQLGVPAPLFRTQVGNVLEPNGQQYDVAPDGQRFLMNTVQESVGPLGVIVNWKDLR